LQKRLEKLGDLFNMPPKGNDDKRASLLAEAYLVMLLHTVVSEQGGGHQQVPLAMSA
jgi:hypothetical protein